MPATFWETAAASMRPGIRRRYGRLFEAAEQYEPLIDMIVNAERHLRAALATALRSTARKLDMAAQRLSLR